MWLELAKTLLLLQFHLTPACGFCICLSPRDQLGWCGGGGKTNSDRLRQFNIPNIHSSHPVTQKLYSLSRKQDQTQRKYASCRVVGVAGVARRCTERHTSGCTHTGCPSEQRLARNPKIETILADGVVGVKLVGHVGVVVARHASATKAAVEEIRLGFLPRSVWSKQSRISP